MQDAGCGVSEMQISNSKLQIERRRRGHSAANGHSLPPASRILHPRSAFTLIELLITILIISILAALVLGVAAVAGETARQAQTKHMVERLHTLLTEYYDTYKTRRVKVRPQIEQGINSAYSRASDRGIKLSQARLYALRELMIMELPDRWSDVLLADVPTSPTSGVTGTGVSYARYPYFEDTQQGTSAGFRPPLASVYLRRYATIAVRNNTITGQPNTREDIIANEGAECLFMIITQACGDGEARSLFAESSIGDTDGDGAPEFLDGWGHPIDFLRWAPGFDSQIQTNANQLKNSADWATAATKDHDPFDVFRVDMVDPQTGMAAFRLVPLIISSGRDEAFGIRPLVRPLMLQGLTSTQLNSIPTPNSWPAIRPYAPVTDPSDSQKVFQGTDIGDGTSTDNVHNHFMQGRK